jgi:hypothetical protein
MQKIKQLLQQTMFVFHTCDLVEKDACDLGLKKSNTKQTVTWEMKNGTDYFFKKNKNYSHVFFKK